MTPRRLLLPGLALALAALLAPVASANADAGGTLVGRGLHISTGSLVDPSGRTWVADHNAGFCRMTEPSDTSAGRIEHPERPSDQDSPRTCLGGLLPDAGTGPDAAGQPTLVDPTPGKPGNGDEVALIPDGASPSSDVVRARWEPGSGRPGSGHFTYLDTVPMVQSDADKGSRPVATSLGADGNVYVVFQRESTIQRITDPAAAKPTVQVVGQTASGERAGAIAAGKDAAGNTTLYIAEDTGLTSLRPGNQTTVAQPAFPSLGVTAIGALAYDTADNKLLVGTADEAATPGSDVVHRINVGSGNIERTYAGFSMIGGLSVRPNGEGVDVADDPALLDPAEPMGMGRMFRVGGPVGRAAGLGAPTSDTTPSFTVTGDGELECLLSGPGLGSARWNDCADDGVYQVEPTLADGNYTLSVLATVDGVTGLPEATPFVIDTKGPEQPAVVRPAEGVIVGSKPWFEFKAERNASFRCSFDDAVAEVCKPGRTHTFTDAVVTPHTLKIVAVDAAGNESVPSHPVNFKVDPSLAPTFAPRPAGAPPIHSGSSLFATGMHISTGAIVDPVGRTWVSDHNGGFCRLTASDDNGPGRIDHPEIPGDDGPRTCLGGLLPDAGQGPDAAGAPAFVDPTPERNGNGDEVVLIPDGASPSSDVVRARWNPDSGLFEFLGTVPMLQSDADKGARPVATSLGADGNVYVVFQRESTIQRITNPTAAEPTVQVVGQTASGERAGAIAAGKDAQNRNVLYIAEDTGLTSLRPNSATTLAQPAFPLLGVTAIGALAYDAAGKKLLVGTADEAATPGSDVVHRIDVTTANGAIERNYARGFSMIGGLSVHPDGFLLVLDDPALLDPAEPLGTGRMFHIGLPAAHIQGPLVGDQSVANPGFVRTGTPTFKVAAAEGTAQCRLQSAGDTVAPGTGWTDCPAGGTFTPAAPLAEGSYVFAVRAVDTAKGVIGLVETHRFEVDTKAPARPEIVSPTAGTTVSLTPWFEFDAKEPRATFECRWDGQGAWKQCQTGRWPSLQQEGERTLVIRAIDRAGNVSVESAPSRFNMRGVLSRITIQGGPDARTRDTSATFGFTADASGFPFECRMDGAATWTRCTSPQSYTGLSEGTHTFEVRGTDWAENTVVAKRSFTIDRTGPVLTLDVADNEPLSSADTITVSANESATLRCAFDGATFRSCNSAIPVAALAPGEHVLRVVGTDDVGNVGAQVTRRFTIVGATAPAPAPAPAPAQPQQAAPAPAQPRAAVAALSLRVTGAAPVVDLGQRSAGVALMVSPSSGTELIRVRVRRAGSNRAVISTFKRAPRGRGKVRLTKQELRKLRPGRYVLELAPARSRTEIGTPVRRAFRVVR